jgi:hypothetical protein
LTSNKEIVVENLIYERPERRSGVDRRTGYDRRGSGFIAERQLTLPFITVLRNSFESEQLNLPFITSTV